MIWALWGYSFYPGDRIIAYLSVAVVFSFCRFAANICRDEWEDAR